MRLIITFLVLTVFLVSFASADIIIAQQPTEFYNLGDILDASVTLITSEGIYDYLQISLICDNHEKRLPKEEISLAANHQKTVEKSIFLINKFIGKAIGNCLIKASLDSSQADYVLSNEFEISNILSIEAEIEEKEFAPGEEVEIEGKVTKKNERPVNGILNLTLIFLDSLEERNYQGTVNDGLFLMNFEVPNDAKAGVYDIKLGVYEKDPLNEKTNEGVNDYNFVVKQVPTSLEIVFETSEVEPGSNLRVKAILHDQTGENVISNAVVTIKNQNNKILEQMEIGTDEFFEYPTKYNDPVSEWTVVGVSNKIVGEAIFNVIEKQDVKVDVINKTLILTNIGNVFYNKTLLIKLGEEDTLNVNPELEVDESKKYILSAPDGEYNLEIIANDESRISKSIQLTGKVVSLKEFSNIGSVLKHPFSWIFMVLILGFISYISYKKGFKKTFFGGIGLKRKEEKGNVFSKKTHNINPKNRAEFSLSIKGNKQKANIVCLNLKNFEELKKKTESTDDTLNKIIGFAEEKKSYVYENQDNLFFILVPLMTKTFNNEMNAVEIGRKIKEVIDGHNKLFKQRISFGVSVNSGEIISKKEDSVLKFMGLGNLVASSKKIAKSSSGEVYLVKEIRDKLMSRLKTEKHTKGGVEVYSIKEIKKDGKENKKFITEFIKRIEGKSDKKKKD